MWWRRRTQIVDPREAKRTKERSFVNRGREDRPRRRRLTRKVKKLLRQAPERRPAESGEEYTRRIRPWVAERVNEATDPEGLWTVILSLITEHGTETVPTESEHWIDLARRYGRREGGAVHITYPAIELFERYGYDPSVSIVKHFKQGGAEEGVRSYFRVGDSLSHERVAVEYVAEQDAVVIWRWGEADHDPDLSILEEHDIDA